MKKSINYFLIFSAIILCFISCEEKTDSALIEGRYLGKFDVEIVLSKVADGQTEKVAVVKPQREGAFSFIYKVDKPGLFVVNLFDAPSGRKLQRDHDLKRFYLEAGTVVEIELRDGSYELVQTNSKKNEMLTKWNNQIDTAYSYSHGFVYHKSNYTDYFPMLPSWLEEASKFKSSLNTGDTDFDELVRMLVDVDLVSSALMMLYTPRGIHPKKEEHPDFYKEILTNYTPSSERLLELPNARSYINSYITFALMSRPEMPAKEEHLSLALAAIPNDLLKGYYALDRSSQFRTYDDEYIAYYNMIKPYLKNDYLIEKFKAFELTIRKFEKGTDAFDIAGVDAQGKEHKLSDYKGTVVYVDVWATWCGPCKAQIPALKELEKKFHNQPITFLSISVDKPGDKSKWIDFVKKENLGGVQIIADKAFESEFAKAYEINAIPRFMLFDKEGKVITIDAPRPSEEKTEALLRQML